MGREEASPPDGAENVSTLITSRVKVKSRSSQGQLKVKSRSAPVGTRSDQPDLRRLPPRNIDTKTYFVFLYLSVSC